jgi:hypothetical protein
MAGAVKLSIVTVTATPVRTILFIDFIIFNLISTTVCFFIRLRGLQGEYRDMRVRKGSTEG